jgi:hypothetical protein
VAGGERLGGQEGSGWGANEFLPPLLALAAICSDAMPYLDNQFLSISDSEPFHNRLRVRPMQKHACPSGGGTQRRGRQQAPPIA